MSKFLAIVCSAVLMYFQLGCAQTYSASSLERPLVYTVFPRVETAPQFVTALQIVTHCLDSSCNSNRPSIGNRGSGRHHNHHMLSQKWLVNYCWRWLWRRRSIRLPWWTRRRWARTEWTDGSACAHAGCVTGMIEYDAIVTALLIVTTLRLATAAMSARNN